MLVVEAWWGWFYSPFSGYKFHAMAVYLYPTGAIGVMKNLFNKGHYNHQDFSLLKNTSKEAR